MPRFVIFDFLNKLKSDPTKLEILGSGQQERDFTFVTDTVQGLLQIGHSGVVGEAYNIATGVSYTVEELARALIRILNLNSKLHFTGESWLGDAQVWRVSINKLSELGYKPNKSLDQGLEETIKWFNSI
jgi:UDP-glucose 4-epimerase